VCPANPQQAQQDCPLPPLFSKLCPSRWRQNVSVRDDASGARQHFVLTTTLTSGARQHFVALQTHAGDGWQHFAGVTNLCLWPLAASLYQQVRCFLLKPAAGGELG